MVRKIYATEEERLEAARESRRKWGEKNREKVNDAGRKRRAEITPEQREKERAYRKDYYQKNQAQVRANGRRSYESNKELWILGNIRARSRAQGIPFDLTVEDIKPPEFCPVLGLKLERNSKGKQAGPQPNSPSVDRIDPAKGYVKGNVIVVSHLANCIKQNAEPWQIRKVADFYESLMQQDGINKLKELCLDN